MNFKLFMAVIRLIILVTAPLGLIILLVQNLSPSLPLVFLGMRTQSLPLALWILFSIITGMITSVIIISLMKFTTYLNLQEQPIPVSKSIPRSSRVKPNTPPPTSPPPPVSQFDDEFDDWETNRNEDNWNDEDNLESVPEASPPGTRPSSVYSYSSQSPKNTAVGKTETIYDADYRVIIPPYEAPSQNKATDDDDWDFFEDDEFTDDNENKPKKS
ncbi:MAG: LapA family protein [Cuspidothrix sp.]